MRSRVELFEAIRRERRLEGVSIRELADRHQVHRRTVRQALDSAVPRPRKAYPPRPRPAIDPWAAVIDGWLLADRDAPRKQRHTARRIWQRLVAEHRCVAVGGDGQPLCRVAAPGAGAGSGRGVDPADPPGRVLRRRSTSASSTRSLGGVAVKCWMFVMRLSNSGRAFHIAFATQAQEAFLDGHVRAFAHFGGVPARGALRQPETRCGPGLQGSGPGRVRAVHRAAQPLRVRLVLLSPRPGRGAREGRGRG